MACIACALLLVSGGPAIGAGVRPAQSGGNPNGQNHFPVEASHIMMFARAIGDTNPVYHDAEAAKKTEAGGIIAPPSFAAGGRAVRPRLPSAPEARARNGSAPPRAPSGVEGKPPSSRRAACRAALRIHPPAAPRRRADAWRPSRARPGRRKASAPAS